MKLQLNMFFAKIPTISRDKLTLMSPKATQKFIDALGLKDKNLSQKDAIFIS